MYNSKDFRRTTKRGLRASRPTLIVHAVQAPDDVVSMQSPVSRSGPRIGFVVSGAVGNAVTRNRVKRRMRHLAAAYAPKTPGGIDIVVRALPRAAEVPAEVPEDFGSAWHEVVSRVSARRPLKSGGAR
jgi:ribonuclease P protein component